MDASSIIGAVTTSGAGMAGFFKWLQERRAWKKKLNNATTKWEAELNAAKSARQSEIDSACSRRETAEELVEKQRKLLLYIYEGLEGIQRPFDVEELRSAIRKHNALDLPWLK